MNEIWNDVSGQSWGKLHWVTDVESSITEFGWRWHGFIFFSCLLFYVLEIFHNKKLKGKETMKIFRAPREFLIEWWLCRGRGSSCWLALDREGGGLFFSTGGGRSDGVFMWPCWRGRNGPGARGEWQVQAQGRGLTTAVSFPPIYSFQGETQFSQQHRGGGLVWAEPWACPKNMVPVTLAFLGTKGMAFEVRSADVL